MVIVVVFVTNAGTVFHVIVIVPVAADGPSKVKKPLSGLFNVPLIEPLMLVMFASFVVQPVNEPFTEMTVGEPPVELSAGLKPAVPFRIVLHETVSVLALTGGAPAWATPPTIKLPANRVALLASNAIFRSKLGPPPIEKA
jgi:hypothetical protein